MPQERSTAIINLLLTNEAVPYVVTKDWDKIGSTTTEVLVNDREEFVKKLGLKKDRTAPEPFRTLYKWRYGVKNHHFEVREVMDDYYHKNLGDRLLKGRVKDINTNIYRVNPNDEFFEILYNCIYRIGSVPADEQQKLVNTKPRDFKSILTDQDYGHQYLCNLGYFPIKCKDESVALYVP